MIAAAIAILIGVYVAATGRGGELAYEHPDHAPLDLGPVSATDIAMLRPPTALWGYNVDVTDEALGRIARAMRERDVTIAYLQSRLADLAPQTASLRPPTGTASVRPPAETASLRPPAGTASVRPPAGTAPLGPVAETAPLRPAAETTSAEPPGPPGEAAADDGALAPKEQPR
jgi:hypothetical protein